MKRFSVFFAAAFLAAAVLPAQADTTGLTLKAGGVMQANSDAQGYGSSYFSLGAAYDLNHATALTPFNVAIYGDKLGKSLGFGFSARSATPVYIGAGAGVYPVSIVRNYGGPASAFPGGGPQPATTANGVGGKIFAGTTFAKVVILEAGYHIMPQVGGTNTNAITAQLGVPF